MVVGYDCYHDTVRRGSSVGAFVCSLNPSATRWYSRANFHLDRNEMSSNFAGNLTRKFTNICGANTILTKFSLIPEGLKEYRNLNGRLPDRLIVYRDGVGEGQISHVYNFEVAQIRDAVQAMVEQDQATNQIKWAFIIVTKRINAKFFYKRDDRYMENPPPGTVIDSVVTRRDRNDFYLISQSVRQGTVNPTMYNIVTDDTQWRPIHHQQMANKLCHLYFNWAVSVQQIIDTTLSHLYVLFHHILLFFQFSLIDRNFLPQGTISTPAPCQYAHKLAYLTGTSLHQEPDPRLGNYLFYL